MFFRNRILVRVIASFLLLETVATIVAPSVSWAVMGPTQPEFTAYESAGSPDMVNLTTGDMTYNMPILEVPGPERSFSLPLTYRAGIGLEQEASWVGLGWSLNAGAIARGLNGYPDDAANDPYTSTFKKELNQGWAGGVPNLLELGWDSETGHSGTASLIGLASVGWAGGKLHSGDLIGVSYTRGKGVDWDPGKTIQSIATIGSAGAGAAAGGMSMGTSFALQAGTSALAATGLSMVGKSGTLQGGYSRPAVKTRKRILHTNYWVFYNDNKREMMYGSLYFNEMSKRLDLNNNALGYQRSVPVYWDQLNGYQFKPRPFYYQRSYSNGSDEREVGADVYQHVGRDDNDYYVTGGRPISVAHDDFSVMGTGVSGTMRPYRLEVGSLAFPKKMSALHDKYNLISYLDDYKPGFRYENSASNGYDYHSYTPSNSTDSPDGVNNDENGRGAGYNGRGVLIVKDPRIMGLDGPAIRTAPARKGLYNTPVADPAKRERRLVQGKHVEWYSNEEILRMYQNSPNGNGSGFLEFQQPEPLDIYPDTQEYVCDDPDDRSTCHWATVPGDTRVTMNNPFRVTLPGKGVGAFAVTAEDGTTYHYSLPVYHYTQFGRSEETVGEVSKRGVSTQTMGEVGSKFAYATTWLLTAITSSDYIDRGNQGVIDDADWGGWVKFNYGKFSTKYKWRQPYIGSSYSAEDLSTNSFSEGYKETYYLNSIRTRTHTALFVKSVRQDARGHFRATGSSNLGINETTPSSSLRLDQIVLLNNEDLAKLETADGIREAGAAGDPVPALSVNTANNAATFDGAELRNGDTYAQIYDQHDLDTDTRIRDFINQRALKRVVFNYSYALCPGTPSSFADLAQLPDMSEQGMSVGRSGKLTLESIATYGPLNTKLAPDYVFHYGFNPTYGKEHWDGFGMYKSDGQRAATGHQVSADFAAATQDAAAWSLVEIVNPLGGRTEVTYERDQYAHISEHSCIQNLDVASDGRSNTLTVTGNKDPRQFLQIGSVFKLDGFCYAKYDPCTGVQTPCQEAIRVYKDVQVVGLTANEIIVNDGPRITKETCTTPCPLTSSNFSGKALIPVSKNGGDIRVAAITTSDENNNRYQVRYRYNTELGTIAASTGVISKEPDFVKETDYPFYAWVDYPNTPVMYGKVTVLKGRFRTGDTDHDQREEFSFYTPTSSMVSETSNGNYGTYLTTVPLLHVANRTVVNLGKLGQPEAIRKYNRQGDMEFSTTFGYENQLPNSDGIAGQGKFTEGGITAEIVGKPGPVGYSFVQYRINRSTKEYIPTVLATTTTVANGVRVEARNDQYDFLSGQIVETSAQNSRGLARRSKTVLAYMLAPFAAMGAKGDNSANRNMLTQEAASYTYKGFGANSAVLSASVQTWKSDWQNYRVFPSGATRYVEDTDANANEPIWRQHESYVWHNPQLNLDGSYKDFIDFNWSRQPLSSQNAGWLKAGEVTRYNHYSQALESKDVNGMYTARKPGHNESQMLATAANARYTEMTYSGAEDQLSIGNITHFGGEVQEGGRRDGLHQHTGLYSTKLSSGESGFTYRALVGNTNEISTNRKYRLSAWIHSSDAGIGNGRLYAQVGNTQLGETSVTASNTKKAGNWYLLNLYITVPASATGQELTVGCKNVGNASVYFDDFRFHPLNAPLTASVYDPHTWQVTYTLDNDNLYTRYEYDNAGKLKRVYKETLDRPNDATLTEKKVKEYEYNYAQQRYRNREVSRTLTRNDCTGTTGSSEIYTVRFGRYVANSQAEADAQAQADLTANAQNYANANGSCTVIPCASTNDHPRKIINGQCEDAQLASTECVACQNPGGGGVSSQNVYHWVYSNGETDTRYSACMPGDCVAMKQTSAKTTDSSARKNKQASKNVGLPH
jgi:hypothetical protein